MRIEDAGGHLIAGMATLDRHHNRLANARLISAAPEMAKLLGVLLKWRQGDLIGDLVVEARALLARIEGE